MGMTMAEKILGELDRYTGVRSVALRYFNACGGEPEVGLGEMHRPETHLIPVCLQQADAGMLPRPRTPDWAKVEKLLGIELNKALQAGSGGGAALDVAAGQVKDYLTQAGYYK